MIKTENVKKMVIIARDGSYDGTLNLDESGRGEMTQLGAAIYQLAKGMDLKIVLLSSTADRARQGAKIIAPLVDIPEPAIVYDECLYVDSFHLSDSNTRFALVEKYLQEGVLLIVLTHLDGVAGLARFAATKLNAPYDRIGQITDVGYGEGWVVTAGGIWRIPRP